MKSTLKRFASIFAVICIMISCMVPAVFATDDIASTVSYEIGGQTYYDQDSAVKALVTHLGSQGQTVSESQAKNMLGNYIKITTTGISDNSDGGVGAWQRVLSQYRGVISGLSGVAAITMIVFFIINFMKLGAAAGNPTQRSQALMGIIWTGLAAAGCGGVSIFVGFFYNVLL